MDQQVMLSASLNLWTLFFLLAAGQGLFLCITLFLSNNGNRLANRTLGLFIGLFALTLFEYFLHWTRYILLWPHFMSIYEPIIFLFGPLLYLYFRYLKSTRRLHWWEMLHFLPFLLYTINRMPLYLSTAAAKYAVLNGQPILESGIQLPFINIYAYKPWLFVGHPLLYVFILLAYLHKEQFLLRPDGPHKVQQGIRRRWTITLLALYLGFVLSNLSYYVLVGMPFFNPQWDYAISLAMLLFVYVVGYLGFRQPEIFSGELMPQLFQADKYQHSSLTSTAAQSLLRKLLHYMDTEQPYLDNEVRLDAMAEKLGCSRHHLSQVINQELNKSFSELMNDYRIKEVEQLLKDPANQKRYIIELAYSAGFNNKTSFNKAFKLRTGLSPSQYRRQFRAKGTPKNSY
ncbi:MAG: AraC family transcriptional regulator [Bacteroidota bacterium]